MTNRSWSHLLLGLSVALLVCLLFQLAGVASPALFAGRSLFLWVGREWSAAGGDMSHAWLMPLISLGIVWWTRHDLREAPKQVCWGGFALVVASLALHWMSMRAQQPRFSLVALATLLWAIPLFLYGGRVGRLLRFPCAYLMLCFVSYFLVVLTFRLRLLASIGASVLLNGLGIEAQRVGTAIYSRAGGGFNFDVADACSGLRSLVVMTMIAAPYAYFMKASTARRWALFLLSIPLAVAANTLRIVTIALIAQIASREFAMRVYHDFSGYMVFALSIILLTVAARLLQGRTTGTSAPPQPVDAVRPEPAAVPARAYALTLITLAVAGAVTLLTGTVHVVSPSAVVDRLPERVGVYEGGDVLCCQNDQCNRTYRREELADPSKCPRCGSPLDTEAIAEHRILPADTVILRKEYRDPTGVSFLVSVVLAGKDRTSIHKPQVCLVAQGHAIRDERVLNVTRAGEATLPVMILDVGGAAGGAAGYYVYWFVAEGRETPYHWQRLFWTAWDGIVHGVHRRWAYVAVTTHASGSREARTETLARFVAELRPLIIRRSE